MILILGGSNQGKLFFVKKNYKIEDKDIFTLGFDTTYNDLINTNAKCIYHLERITNYLYDNMIRLDDIKEELINKFQDKIIICEDISNGVVPMDKDKRIKREMAGTINNIIASEAKTVIEIIVGMERILKNEDLSN